MHLEFVHDGSVTTSMRKQYIRQVSSTSTSFFSSVVERGIAAMQVILRSLFRSREGAVLLPFLHSSTDRPLHLPNKHSAEAIRRRSNTCFGKGRDAEGPGATFNAKFFSSRVKEGSPRQIITNSVHS
jgi:hypothetical protein